MTGLMDIIATVSGRVVCGSADVCVVNIAFDSRSVEPGSLFVCVTGNHADGHNYIANAVERGAVAVVVEEAVWAQRREEILGKAAGATVVVTENTRRALAYFSACLYDYPSEKLRVYGLTGTKGKTTCSYILRKIFLEAKKSVGFVGTTAVIAGDKEWDSNKTTPEAATLQCYLKQMVDAGDEICVMEVSSTGLKQQRAECIAFQAAAFLNLYTDHIGPDEHEDMEEYFSWKMALLDRVPIAFVNGDISYTDQVVERVVSRGGKVYTFGFGENCDVRATEFRNTQPDGADGSTFVLSSPWYQGELVMNIPLEFNVMNALCAICFASLEGIPFETIQSALKKVSIPGRIQKIPFAGDFTVYVDYAHNPKSLEHLLKALRKECKGRLITVFGCGGDRSLERRHDMGEVSGWNSDFTIVTTDNPRSEDPRTIMEAIAGGIPEHAPYVMIENRREAIQEAISMAKTDDMVIIAGKGHEKTQTICGISYPFDDAVVAAECLAQIRTN